ncbi:hypothetical protein [Photobacterium leiognathi]|uniref:hypothetical protein n=1 Tax=Photobacterium leiognathi TaxID=553611 RepID=UPI002980CEDD|nr:hypothetical protein [Photobacterium leiognathi]
MKKFVSVLILLAISCQASANGSETSIKTDLVLVNMGFYLCDMKLQTDISQKEINSQHKMNFDCINEGKDNLKTLKKKHQVVLKKTNLSEAYKQFYIEVMNSYSTLFTLANNGTLTSDSGANLRVNIEHKYNEFMYHYDDM